MICPIRLLRSSVIVNNLVLRMTSKFSYEDAVQKLNTLQSNQAALAQIISDIKNGNKSCTNIENMERYLDRCGVPLTTLDKLSVVHVAGTKGKGSTSAMCESILRHHGYKTGFYSSPHLVSVCERIRLEGQVISKEKFARYFENVYNMLYNTQTFEGDMPKYFAFLTVLAYIIFLNEKVDVAIVEVGIGGKVDYTNVLRKVQVVGITALGLDHTSILGNTIEEIAEAKAGIMKPHCKAYTVQQPVEAMEVLRNVANNTKSSLHVSPNYHNYNFPKEFNNQIDTNLSAYYTNASLAIQLAHAWMRLNKVATENNNNLLRKEMKNEKSVLIEEFTEIVHDKDKISDDAEVISDVPLNTLLGVRDCKWPGRYHIVKSEYADFYLDGAHTKESMEICSTWFNNITKDRCINKVLIFSTTGDRNSATLLSPLLNINFDVVYFVVPTAYKNIDQKNDNYSAMEQKSLLARCEKHVSIWNELQSSEKRTKTIASECVSEVLIHLKRSHNFSCVLVTGSLHLVGATLSIVDPTLSKD